MLTEITTLAVTALVSVVMLVALIRHAGFFDLVDHPRGRKDHVAPVPVIGGIAMLVAIAAGLVVAGPMSAEVIGLLACGGLMVMVGVLDDRFDLNWRWRILGQTLAAALLALFAGVSLQHLGRLDESTYLSLGWAAVPFTVFAVVGLINAVNMIDGVDGLAGTLVLISLVLMAVLYPGGSPDFLMVLAVSAVAIAVFLAFNSRLPGRARALTFMGNSGSAFLGLLLAWAAIRLTHDSVPAVTPALAPWLVALPIMDCLVLIVRRMREGRSPFDADRCHFHHLLLDRSWRVPSVVIVAALVHLGLGLFGLALHALGMPDLGLIVAFIAMTVVHYFVSGWLRAERGAAQLLTVASVISRD
jgi:UDP-GlcNAc:undecaprenyl-phosphate GlcNAc-1-phosphate transferase